MLSQNQLRTWPLAVLAALLSIGSAVCYIGSVGQGIVVGALLGLSGREADVAAAQGWARGWLIGSVLCLVGSAVVGSVSITLFSDAERVPRSMARLLLALVLSVGFTAVVILVAESLVTAFHRSAITR